MPRSWISAGVSDAPGSRTFSAMLSISVRTRALIAALGPITMSISVGVMHWAVSPPQLQYLCGVEEVPSSMALISAGSAGPMNCTRGLPPVPAGS
jgi:hypothetical protein